MLTATKKAERVIISEFYKADGMRIFCDIGYNPDTDLYWLQCRFESGKVFYETAAPCDHDCIEALKEFLNIEVEREIRKGMGHTTRI